MLILYVEDDLEDVENFQYIIQLIDPKLKLIHCKNGVEALSYLENAIVQPDYIFLDINMPIMGGKEFLIRTKAGNKVGKIPVIIYTTSNRAADKTELLALGAHDYVVKPNSYKEAVEGIARVLRSPGT